VPTRYGHHEVLAKGYVDRVEIVCRGEMSMADTNCTRWRRKTVPVWLIEKGAHAPSLVRLVCCAL
jgi:hypothetical protein